jgi:phospholipid/cholesterol/gamma-HCH transport system permease protein
LVNTDFEVLKAKDSLYIKLYGELRTLGVATAQKRVAEILADVNTPVVIDVSSLFFVDSAGALFLIGIKRDNSNLRIVGLNSGAKSIFRLVLKNSKNRQIEQAHKQPLVEKIGRLVHSKILDFLEYAAFFGALVLSFPGIFREKNFRLSSIIKQMELAGINALPIVALSSFLIGVVVTYQGALQLEKFGAAIFTVDLVGISITRELAPLLTAVVIAGRSGASFTSELGVMKITEEIDAMKTMGFSPYYFLVWPRILALTLTLWLVIFFADAVAVMGGMMVAKLQLAISYTEFLQRLQTSLELKHILVGLFKAPFFAFLIASIGIFRGLQVRGSSESIGVMTTYSVVNSIFAVIACDALFAVIFTRLGI